MLLLACASFSALGHESASSAVIREAFALRPFDGVDLPQSTVRAVHVCDQGYLWIGTREGLVRFKAGENTVYPQTTDGLTGLPSGKVNVIHEDRSGRLWIGTARGIARKQAQSDTFEVYLRSSADRATQFDVVDFATLDGNLMAVTATGEVLALGDDAGKVLQGPRATGEFAHAPLTELLVTSATAGGNALFVGTADNGIYRLRINDAGYEIDDVLIEDSAVVNLHSVGRTVHWLDRDHGPGSFRMGDKPIIDGSGPAQPTGYHRGFFAPSPQSIWYGNGPYVVRQRDGQIEAVRLPGPDSEVLSISVDRTGNVWVGSYDGLYHVADSGFDTYRVIDSDRGDRASTMTVLGDSAFFGGSNLWYGARDGQRFEPIEARLDPAQRGALRILRPGDSQPTVTALAASDDLLLIGYYAGGFDVLDLESGNASSHMEDGPGDQQVGISSFVQVDSTRWLATVFRYGLVELNVRRGADGTPNVAVRTLLRKGELIGVYAITGQRYLVVDNSGLWLADRAETGAYDVRAMDVAPEGIVFAATADGRGGVYLGMENTGLRYLTQQSLDEARFDPERVSFVEPHIAQRTVWSTLIDTQRRLWLTTSSGIYTFDLETSKLLTHAGYAEGLPANEFDSGPMSVATGPGDELYFTSIAGIISPQHREQTPEVDLIALTWSDIRIDGSSIERLPTRDEAGNYQLDLAFSQLSDRILRLNYGFFDHVRAIGARYAARFGDSGPWIDGGSPSVTLADIQTWGPIEISVAMRDASGNFISAPLNLTVEVSPPAYVIGFVDLRYAIPGLAALAGLLYAVYFLAGRRERLALERAAQQRQIAEAEMRGRISEKEVLLREIHHRVGNLLSSFAANVRSMQRNADSEETRKSLEELNRRIKVQSAVHQLLQRSDDTQINVSMMLRQVVSGARDLMESDDALSITLELDDIFMTYSKAQYLGLITNELLTNSYKHGRGPGAELASISLRQAATGDAQFVYQDHGPGLPESVLRDAYERPRSEALGGLAQVIAMIRELRGQESFRSEAGMRLEFRIHKSLCRDPSAPAPATGNHTP